MIARRTARGLPAVLVGVVLPGVVVLLGIAGCGDDQPTLPASVTTTSPPAVTPTVAPVPAVGAPIVPTESSTTTPSSPTRRTSRRPPTTTPTRRTVTVPDNASGRALFRCLASGRTYDECVN